MKTEFIDLTETQKNLVVEIPSVVTGPLRAGATLTGTAGTGFAGMEK